MNIVRSSFALATISFSLAFHAGNVHGFAEEPIDFREPTTSNVWDETESTFHTELTYVLALAAGFSTQSAATIAIWDQLVDAEKLGPGATLTYTNCLGSFGPAPDKDAVCPGGSGAGQQVWPMTYDSTCATSRFGPYSPFFHFPHNTEAEIGALREWGWGRTQNLMGYAAYAWGGPTDTVLSAACRYMRPEVINTGMSAGSLQAFATYLHSLADRYSHGDCLAVLAGLSLPNLWGTHTVVFSADTKECYYVPSNPKNDDAHGQEFGSGLGTPRTDAAAAAIFNELVQRSIQMEGEYVPLTMDTVLAGMDGAPTLQAAITQFIHNWDFQKEPGLNPGEYAANRRDFSDLMAAQILGQRTLVSRSIDVDLSAPDSKYDALTDGLLLLRYMFGLSGAALTSGALGDSATRSEPVAVKNHLDTIRSSLDIDGNGTVDAFTDGLLVLRYMVGLRGDPLISGALGPGATNNTASAIETYIQSLMP